jgi:hypothetical protein
MRSELKKKLNTNDDHLQAYRIGKSRRWRKAAISFLDANQNKQMAY